MGTKPVHSHALLVKGKSPEDLWLLTSGRDPNQGREMVLWRTR